MDIIGNRKFVEVAGNATHELPPLLINGPPVRITTEKTLDRAAQIVDGEDMIPPLPVPLQDDPQGMMERLKWDLALNLVEGYADLIAHWNWGNCVMEWVRQCEFTFETHPNLRGLLRPDVWPHAGRSSFISLLEDKYACSPGINLRVAVGFRFFFRQPPPISCFTDKFLFFLKTSTASSAYQEWASKNPEPVSYLPPERFHFQIHMLD